MEPPARQDVTRRVLLDLDRCIECQSCAAACFYSHANMPVVQFAGAGWALLPLICRQCIAAPCVEACPVEAMARDEHGIVRRKPMLCTGCGSCASACPFGVIWQERARQAAGADRSTGRLNGQIVAKCDLCADRTVGGGQAGVPRCVAACPTAALRWADEHPAAGETIEVLGGRTIGQHPYRRR